MRRTAQRVAGRRDPAPAPEVVAPPRDSAGQAGRLRAATLVRHLGPSQAVVVYLNLRVLNGFARLLDPTAAQDSDRFVDSLYRVLTRA